MSDEKSKLPGIHTEGQQQKAHNWVGVLKAQIVEERDWFGVLRLWCKLFGHKLHTTDRGYLLGSNRVDRWCRRCGKMITITLAEEDYGNKS